jgi:very-short-patch-repair endonuclease
MGPKAAELALDDALRRKLTTIERLWDEYARSCDRGRNGCRTFRKALLRRDYRDGTLQSRMEAKMRAIVRSLPGRAPIPQVAIQTPDDRYVIDFAFPELKLGIEAQSIKWHMGEAKFCYDLRRDRKLKLEGWTLVYYTWDDLLRPATVRDEIDRLRRSRERILF